MPQIHHYAATRLCAAAAVFVMAAGGVAEAQAPNTAMLILGEIEQLTVNDRSDRSSAGSIVISGKQIIIPGNLLIGLPTGRLTVRDLVLDGPEPCASQDPPQSGLAVSDTCRNDRSPGLARVVANRTASGDLVASLVMVQKDSARTLARIRPQSPRAVRHRARAYPQQPSDGGTSPNQPVKPPR